MEHEDEEDNKRKPLTVGFRPPRRCVLWFLFVLIFFFLVSYPLSQISLTIVVQKSSSDWWTVIEIARDHILLYSALSLRN